MIGAVAALVVYFSGALSATYPWAGAVWLVFISWALYFMAGAKVSRIHKYVLGLTGGIVAGWLVLYVLEYMTGVFGTTWALPATIFVVATVIVLLELTSWFELAPAYFFSFAAYFAFVFGGFGGSADNLTQGIWVWAMLMAGIGIGFVSATLRTAILKAQGLPVERHKTVFDSER